MKKNILNILLTWVVVYLSPFVIINILLGIICFLFHLDFPIDKFLTILNPFGFTIIRVWFLFSLVITIIVSIRNWNSENWWVFDIK
jgi:uncharacterized membrane protein HdeD (DUF308 family)